MVASSLVLGCVLILLTVITQLQVHSVTTHGLSWTTLRDALYNCLRLARPRSSSSRQIYSRDGHQLGKRARRTERRRQRRALTKNRLQEHDNKAGDLPANDTHTSQIPRPSPGLDATVDSTVLVLTAVVCVNITTAKQSYICTRTHAFKSLCVGYSVDNVHPP